MNPSKRLAIASMAMLVFFGGIIGGAFGLWMWFELPTSHAVGAIIFSMVGGVLTGMYIIHLIRLEIKRLQS